MICRQMLSSRSSEMSVALSSVHCYTGEWIRYAPAAKLLTCAIASLITFRKDVVAVFHNGRSLPSLDGGGQSYFILIGIAYAYININH